MRFQLTPEQRKALAQSHGEPIQIEDDETRRVYLVIEEGTLASLDEDYINNGLQIAREQIARGEVSVAAIDEVIAKAKKRQPSRP